MWLIYKYNGNENKPLFICLLIGIHMGCCDFHCMAPLGLDRTSSGDFIPDLILIYSKIRIFSRRMYICRS